jgi:integrase
MRGDGRIFQRGDKFWISYYAPQDGRSMEHREPGGKTEGEARKLLRQRLREIAVHKSGLRPFQGPKQERTTVDELLQALERDWQIQERKGLPQLRSHMKHIRAFFAMDRALAVSPDRLRDYIAFRQKEGAASATINRELEGLQRAFALALDSGTLAMAPKFPSLPERNARQGFFERGDFCAILGNLGDSDVSDFLGWFYWTGMRPGEIRSLTWACFDRETWTLRLHAKDAKTGFGRAVALEGPLQEIIKRRMAVRQFGCDLIFHRDGKRVGEFRKLWKSACKLAGIAGRIPYDLRRTAVRNMVRAGVPERVAMMISGHRTRQVFDRYNIVSEKDLREAISKTAAYVETLSTKPSVTPIQNVSEIVQ